MAQTDVKTYSNNSNRVTISLNVFIFFIMGLVAVIARWVSIALFSSEVGAQSLPFVYSVNAVIHFFIALYISMYFSKYAILKFIRWILLGCLIIMIGSGLLLLTSLSLEYTSSILIVSATRVSSVIEMIMWICAAQFFSGQHAKRVYAYLIAANSAGLLVGGGLLIVFANIIKPIGFLAICAFAIFVAYLLILTLEKRFWHSNFDKDDYVDFSNFMKYLAKSPNWLKLLISAVLINCFYYISNFQFILAAQTHFNDLNDLTRFFGYFELASATSIIIFALTISRFIKVYGVWKANALSLLMLSVSFFILFFYGDDIYFSSLSRLINVLFFKLALIVVGIICKNSKEKYQSTLISIFDFVPVSVGTLLAGQLGYLVSFQILTFEQFSLLLALLILAVYAWSVMAKSTYMNVLIGGIQDEQFTKLVSYDKSLMSEFFTTNNLYDYISKNISDTKEHREMAFEVPIKIKDSDPIKIMLSIIEALEDKDPSVRAKALDSLLRYKEVKKLITPLILKLTDDTDIEVAGRAILTLYEFDPTLSKSEAKKVLNELASSSQASHLILAFKIIAILKYKKYKSILIVNMDNTEAIIREHAFLSFQHVCEIDDEQSITLYKKMLGEQNSAAAKALINTILNSIETKKDIFSELLLSKDPFVWKNVSELLIKWRLVDEYPTIILSTINKIHLVYENINSMKSIQNVTNANYFANILTQHLVMQNEAILKGAIFVTAMDAYDEGIVDSLFREIRSFKPNMRSTALELIENIGEKKITKHLIAYFSFEKNDERIEYAKKHWHLEDNNVHSTFEALLQENNEWIKACALKVIGLMQDPHFEHYLTTILKSETSLLVRTYAEIALQEIRQEDTMKPKRPNVDFLDIVVLLKHSKLFKDTNLNTLAIITKSLEEKYFPKNKVIIDQGELVNGIYIIHEGSVSVTSNINEKQKQVLELSNLSVIGAQYMLQETASEESFIAKTDVVALFLSRSLYKNILVLHPEVANGLLNELSAYLINYQKAYIKIINSSTLS